MNDDWKIYLYGGEVMLKTYEIQDGRTALIGNVKGTTTKRPIFEHNENISTSSHFPEFSSTSHAFSKHPEISINKQHEFSSIYLNSFFSEVRESLKRLGCDGTARCGCMG